MINFQDSIAHLDQAVSSACVPKQLVLTYLDIGRATYWQWQQGRYPAHAHLMAKIIDAHADELDRLVEEGVLGVSKPSPGEVKRINSKRYKEYFCD